MKAPGIIISDKARDLKSIQMVIHTKAISLMARPMAKAFTTGSMAKSTTDNGRKALKMDTACGKESMETAIWVNGSKAKLTGMEYIFRKTATDTKDPG